MSESTSSKRTVQSVISDAASIRERQQSVVTEKTKAFAQNNVFAAIMLNQELSPEAKRDAFVKELTFSKESTKELARINTLVADQRVQLVMSTAAIREMVQGVYVPREGARSILGYMDRHITSAIADLVLSDRVLEGETEVAFDPRNKTIELKPRGQVVQPVAQAM
jgi:hypothetical protein